MFNRNRKGLADLAHACSSCFKIQFALGTSCLRNSLRPGGRENYKPPGSFWKIRRLQNNYPGKRPQTVRGGRRIMHDNLDKDDDDDDDGDDHDDDDEDDDNEGGR